MQAVNFANIVVYCTIDDEVEIYMLCLIVKLMMINYFVRLNEGIRYGFKDYIYILS